MLDSLDKILKTYLDDFVAHNRAAKIVYDGLQELGVGFNPIVDHITFRTSNVDERAKEFLKLGFVYDTQLGIIEYENWWAKVYRKKGYPAIFIDQAYDGERGKGSLIPEWVKNFGDKVLHHVAIQVGDIEHAMKQLKKHGIECVGEIVGERGSDLRQIFTKPETVQGKPFSVLELAERHHGYTGFLPPQADGLMESTRS